MSGSPKWDDLDGSQILQHLQERYKRGRELRNDRVEHSVRVHLARVLDQLHTAERRSET